MPAKKSCREKYPAERIKNTTKKVKEEENTEAKVSQSAYVIKSYHRAVEWTDRLISKASCVQIREWTNDQRTCNYL